MKRVLIFAFVAVLLVAVGIAAFSMEWPPLEKVEIAVPATDVTALVIHAEYNSIDQMNASHTTDAVPEGGYVLINTGNVEDPVNAQVYIKRADGYELYCDLSGAKGEQGVQGLTGPAGATPLLRISDDTGMWELSYDAGVSWTSTGVEAQGPQGEQGEKGDKGDTGARGPQGLTGAQGPAYVLTDADKQAIIDAVLAQIGSGNGGSSGGDSVPMYSWNSANGNYDSCDSPSTSHEYQHTCTLCGAQYYDDSSIANIEVCGAPDCTRLDGSFTTENNPYYGGSGSGSGSSGGSSGGSEMYEVMFTWNDADEQFMSTSGPSSEWKYQHTCDYCGAVLYSPYSSEDYCPNTKNCSNIDGYFTTVSNPYYEGDPTIGNTGPYYVDENGTITTEDPGGCYYYFHADCGAEFYARDNEIISVDCPCCGEIHDVSGWSD